MFMSNFIGSLANSVPPDYFLSLNIKFLNQELSFQNDFLS